MDILCSINFYNISIILLVNIRIYSYPFYSIMDRAHALFKKEHSLSWLELLIKKILC